MLVIQTCYACKRITNEFEVDENEVTRFEGGCGDTYCLSCTLKERNPSLFVGVEILAKKENKTTEELLQKIMVS